METDAIFGGLLLAYIIPFWLWQVMKHERAETERRLYPGSGKAEAHERGFGRGSWAWIAGLVGLLLAWVLLR